MSMPAKVESLDLRVTPEVKDVVRQAAATRGQTMTDFVVSVVLPIARELVDERERIRLSEAAWANFVEMTNRPAQVTPLAREEVARFLKNFPG